MGRCGKKLIAGLRLLLYHPEWSRSCEDCARFDYDNQTGQVRHKFGKMKLRVLGSPTPCWKCPKIPDTAPLKTREFAVEMNRQNWQAWEHYQECKAVGRFPDDPIVRRIASICRQVEEARDRNVIAGRLDALTGQIALLFTALRLGR